MKRKIITLIIIIFCSINLSAGWDESGDELLFIQSNAADNERNSEIEDLLCYQGKIIMDDNYAYICKNGKISRHESQSNDEDDPWQLEELDGVSLFDTDNPRLIQIHGNLFSIVKKRINYEAELMDRMSSIQDTGFDGSNGQMYYQAEVAYQAWDKELNKVYKLLMLELPDSQKTRLRNEERAWLKRMANETKKAVYEACGGDEYNGKACGTLAPLEEIGTKLDMVKARTIELAQMYDNLHK